MDISYILSEEAQQQQGISLHELDDYVLELRLKGKQIALFSQGGVELKIILHCAESVSKN